LIDLHYSRAMEIEADDHARALLERNGIPVQALIGLLRVLDRADDGKRASEPETMPPQGSPARSAEPPSSEPESSRSRDSVQRAFGYLSTHPDPTQRIERLLAPRR
ncbi:MAG: M48 family metalloprotease, partial [Proteobacteria bacterium]|nr:M48 family metalloprotease [Burkholderiales bacterium]